MNYHWCDKIIIWNAKENIKGIEKEAGKLQNNILGMYYNTIKHINTYVHPVLNKGLHKGKGKRVI